MRFAELGTPPVPIFQSLVEFGGLWDIVSTLTAPRHIVEIGSLYGGTLWYWLQMPSVESVTSIDRMPLPQHASRDDVLAARALWPSWSDKLRIIEGDSHDPAVLEAVGRTADSVDFLFIDGDHSYDGCSADFWIWSPLVRTGGMVAFHDTVANGALDEPGVRRFVDDLRQQPYLSLELFEPDHGVGITCFVM